MSLLGPGSLLVDIDGTLVESGTAVPGAVAAMEQLHELGYGVRFVTNTSARSAEQIALELRRIGFRCSPAQIFTPIAACMQLLAGDPLARPAYYTSPQSRAMLNARFPESAEPNVLVVGDCGEAFGYPMLNELFNRWMDGAELLALQKNPFWYDHRRRRLLDCGAFVAALEFATGKRARILGKPSPEFVRLVLQDLGSHPEEAILVGDDLTTDIRAAQALGMRAILVETGKCGPKQRDEALAAGVETLRSVADLPALLSCHAPRS